MSLSLGIFKEFSRTGTQRQQNFQGQALSDNVDTGLTAIVTGSVDNEFSRTGTQ